MFSKNLKKKVAVLLTGVMVLGMTVTASAETGSSGDIAGAGTNEGHVSRNVVSVTLPSVKDGTTPFNYTLDPEGLIQETEAAAYGWDKIDATASANRVYFMHDDNKYYGTSNQYTLSNNSAVSVNFVVEVKATKGAKDATLVANEEAVVDGGDDVLLYLGLDVGDKGKEAIKNDDKVSVAFTLAGTPENYEVVCQNPAASAPHTYTFEKKTTPVKDWPSVSFNLIGKCNKVANADGVTAPTLTVTWKYQDTASAAAAAEAAADEEAAEAAATAAANTFKTTYATILAKTAETVEFEDLDDVNAALTAYAPLDATVKAKLTTEKALLDALAVAAAAKESYAMGKNSAGNLTYTFASGKPTGTFTKVIINGVDKSGKIGTNVLYNEESGKFILQAELVTNMGLEEGETTAVATIGGKDYKFTY